MKFKNAGSIVLRSAVTTVAVLVVDWFLRPSNSGDEWFAVDTAAVFSVAGFPLFLAVLIALASTARMKNFGLRALAQSILAASLTCLAQLAAVAWTWPELLHRFVEQLASIGIEIVLTLLIVNLAWEYRNSLAAVPQD